MEDSFMDDRKSARRFELAENSVARSRLDNFRDGLKRFQQQHTEILGATVFGSMIKGEVARAESDVDAFLYIDFDALTEEDKKKDVKDVENKFRSGLLKELGVVSEDEAHEFYHDLVPKLLSKEILDSNIQANIDYEVTNDVIREKRRNLDTSSMTEDEIDKLYSEEPENQPLDNLQIGGMFHARVGSGIEKYRKLFLEKLVALPNREMAEKIWMGVYAQIVTMEAGDKKRIVPRTLEDALQTYHPELTKNIAQKKEEKRIDEIRDHLGRLYDDQTQNS